MEITLNNITMTVQAERTDQGTLLTVQTDKGQWEAEVEERLDTYRDDDVARLLMNVLGTISDMEDFQTFRSWCDYVEHGGGDASEADRENYDKWQEKMHEWNDVTSHLSTEVMDYLQANYDV